MATEADPIDALDLSSAADSVVTTETALPESMILGGERPAEEPAKEETEETESTARDDGRDAAGRFKKDEEADAKSGEQPAPAQSAATPFQYRAMGANHALDGAKLDDKGNLSIPETHVPLVRQALNALHLAQAGESGALPIIQERDAKIQELNGTLEEHVTLGRIAESLISEFDAICKEPDDEKALHAFWKLRAGWEGRMAKAEANYWQLKASRGAQPNGKREPDADAAARTADSGMPSVEDARLTTAEYIEQAKLDTRFRGLSADDWKQYAARIDRTPLAFLRPATAEEAQHYGPIVFDIPAFVADLNDYMTSRSTAKATSEKRTKLAADNARRTQTSVSTPPTPGGGRAVATAGKGGGFQSEKDVEDWLNSSEL